MSNLNTSPRGNKAPSEKHLEDWIVANQSHITYRMGGDTFTLFDRVIGRQARFPSGICDLIGEKSSNLTLLELKAGRIDADAIAQVARYMRDLNAIWHETIAQHLSYLSEPYFNDALGKLSDVGINGVLIGRGLAETKLTYTVELMNILVLEYEFDGTDYTFTAPSSGFDYKRQRQIHAEYAQGWLGDAIRRIADQRLEGGE